MGEVGLKDELIQAHLEPFTIHKNTKIERKDKLMGKIKIAGIEYEIESIRPVTTNVMQIVFTDSLPEQWGDITTYTVGGLEGWKITGYDTVYRGEGKTIQLSNDGSIYVEPDPAPTTEPIPSYIPTLKEEKTMKKEEVSHACKQIIYAGVDVALADGTIEHYSLTECDQINLLRKQVEVSSGKKQIEYHADGRHFRYYSSVDMQTIIRVASQYISYHTTYCNALNIWIERSQTIDEISKIYYGIDVPEEYMSEIFKVYLLQPTDTGITKQGEEV